MNNDFKKSSYLLTILLFFVGIASLVAVSAAKFFTFDPLVVTVSQIVSLLAFFGIFINCIYAKSKYNTACIRFADYILTNRRKESERKTADAEREKEMQNRIDEVQQEREKAVEAALRQGRSEGAQAAASKPPVQQPTQMPQRMPLSQQAVPMMMPMAVPMSVPQQYGRGMVAPSNEEVLYNEYGEPVMVRRRVRKGAYSSDGETLYDGQGNPVVRRNQGLWEPLDQHPSADKPEYASGTQGLQPERFTPNSGREGQQ